MQTAEQIQSQIEALSREEYIRLVHWFYERGLHEHEGEIWDREIENDAESGRLDFLMEEAMEEKNTGKLQDL